MLHIDQEVFIQPPTDKRRRILRAATIIGITDRHHHARFDDCDFKLEPEQEFLVYYNSGADFVKQSASVVGEPQTEPDFVVTFETDGNPVSAETRECYRVSTVISGHTITFAKEKNCPLLDASATGFAVSSSRRFVVANTVPATLVHEDVEYSGRACIHSIRELMNGRIRYGVSCVDQTPLGTNLLAGIQKFNLAMQRQQARRLAGIG